MSALLARCKYRMPIPEILQMRQVSKSNQVPQATGIQNVLSQGEVQVRFSLRAEKVMLLRDTPEFDSEK